MFNIPKPYAIAILAIGAVATLVANAYPKFAVIAMIVTTIVHAVVGDKAAQAMPTEAKK